MEWGLLGDDDQDDAFIDDDGPGIRYEASTIDLKIKCNVVDSAASGIAMTV